MGGSWRKENVNPVNQNKGLRLRKQTGEKMWLDASEIVFKGIFYRMSLLKQGQLIP